MGYRVPSFPLSVNLWRRPTIVALAPTRTFMGNLTPGKRVMLVALPQSALTMGTPFVMELMVPKLTDVVGVNAAIAMDAVEVPAGSGRFYAVAHVDDVAKGFSNEYRLAVLYQLSTHIQNITGNPWAAPVWPTPIP